MKSSLIRPALALALAAGLAGCGGSDKAEFVVKGTVAGIFYPGAVLQTNGQEVALPVPTTPGAAVSFAFPNKLEYGDEYNVTFKSKPQFQDTCTDVPNTVPNGRDTAGRLAEINITFVCYVNAFALKGKVNGLTADGLVLANGSTGGSGTVTKPADGVTTPIDFLLPNVTYGTTYGVVVIAQPTGQVCTVVNGTGTMPNAEVTNIVVNCVPA
ncbi:hypothetical protein [Telluria beijingensis]|uniref:hypothetical protein n=1 Tax=Telluria beijingensis TaxID=3068633 RepID=UPI0027961DE9|nr:hypothetical protein [Massilia sp. REN29]